ncbi:unnamed protein product [Meloidogyne enterolobii]|uniref:Uncharacterized protein n=1 Tax=Meloidogyne enterolobii TaxID=390850 RepID=A0ACB0ZL84_MELEN
MGNIATIFLFLVLNFISNSKAESDIDVETVPNDTIKCEYYETEFDVRDKWPKCSSFINHVENQGICGSSWAIAVASVFTDRHCIESDKKGLITPHNASNIFSAYELLSCAPGLGCDGGLPNDAWEYIESNGICTGSDYFEDSGCKPYPFGPDDTNPIVNSCYNFCTNKKWGVPYDADRKNYASGGYYSDHAVVIVGYGTASCGYEKIPYWIIRNSWGTNSTGKGFLKFRRGNDECGIESQISFGIPKID